MRDEIIRLEREIGKIKKIYSSWNFFKRLWYRWEINRLEYSFDKLKRISQLLDKYENTPALLRAYVNRLREVYFLISLLKNT